MSHPPSVDRARGLLLGLLLGDALAYRKSKPTTRLLGSPASQLACFTVEGMIRALVRFSHRGLSKPQGTVWHAYERWAHIQGISISTMRSAGSPWPDGWLHQQSPLTQRRGNAPATVAALIGGLPGDPNHPVNASAGHHALNSTAPVALFASVLNLQMCAIDVAALTHGDADAQQAAAEGTALLAAALSTASLDAVDVRHATLREAAAGTARAALKLGTAAALEAPEPGLCLEAIAAANYSGGRGAAMYAGAFLGACHGAAQLPQDLVGRLELGMIAGTLARDAVCELAH